CGAQSDPIVRNAQEERQLASIKTWLERRRYMPVSTRKGLTFTGLEPGTFAFRLNVPVSLPGGSKRINIPVDAVILALNASPGESPLLIEAKSAGDFTNPNKRRKEEATKVAQLRATYGTGIRYILFLCGYFD